MSLSNLERMKQLANDFFATKDDPEQLDVNEEVMDCLHKIHPNTVSEFDDGNGPVAWVLLIPTTLELMNNFLENKITEKELFELTPIHTTYEALYLCSALVLEEYRRKGITKKLACDAIDNMRKIYPLKALFVWSFSKEGDLGAEKIAEISKLPLNKKAL